MAKQMITVFGFYALLATGTYGCKNMKHRLLISLSKQQRGR